MIEYIFIKCFNFNLILNYYNIYVVLFYIFIF